MLTQAELLERIWRDVIGWGEDGKWIRREAKRAASDEKSAVIASMLAKGVEPNEIISLLLADRRARLFDLFHIVEKHGVEPEAWDGLHESVLVPPEAVAPPKRINKREPKVALAGGQRLRFSPDGQSVVGDLEGRIANVRTGKQVRCKTPPNACHAAWSSDGKLVALGNDAGVLRLCDGKTGARVRDLRLGERANLETLRFSPDGVSLVVGDHDGGIELWNVSDGKRLHRATIEGARILDLWSSKRGWVVVAQACAPGGALRDSAPFVTFWDEGLTRSRPGGLLPEAPLVPDPSAPAERAWALPFESDRIELFRLRDGKSLSHVTVPDARELACSPDGKLLCVVSGENGEFVFLDARTLKERGRRSEGWAHSVTFSPDGRHIALVTGDHGSVWELSAVLD